MACVETVRCGQVEVRVHRELVMGVSLWPAARPLAEWLTTFGPRGQLLELGCGAGLCALAYAAAGLSLPDSEVAEPSGSTAVLTDGEDAVLELARRNVELNELRDAYVRALDYGPASDADCAALVGEFGRFPLVVGSDIIIEPCQIPRVVAVVDKLLAENGRCVIAMSDGFRSFAATIGARAAERGLDTETVHEAPGGCCLVALRRGELPWALPAFPLTPCTSGLTSGTAAQRNVFGDGGGAPGPGAEDRAELLFA
eukprot:TRINITY_DN4614_c0_g1_i1.p1 TRINITY_DN4614_c0_g1~~TRINITY_DN4614_c0_g1_i1.p1  ORF type:complete len:270 (-),score=34.23 TRINITY_DN4614_c0_g1_i1:202-969(-)